MSGRTKRVISWGEEEFYDIYNPPICYTVLLYLFYNNIIKSIFTNKICNEVLSCWIWVVEYIGQGDLTGF